MERLARLAYSKCAYEVREKIAFAQVIVALSDRFMKRILQLENVSSLRAVIERARAVKIVQESSSEGLEIGRESLLGRGASVSLVGATEMISSAFPLVTGKREWQM